MDINWLDDLVALARTLNFSRAAAARNITQPAFGRRIRALEDWVGAPLVDRSSHRIALTPGGAAMLEVADDVLRSLEAGRRRAREAMNRRPTLRFASTHALSLTVFPSLLMALEPAVANELPITLNADNMAACERMMEAGEVEFLLCHHHPAAPTRLSPRDFSWIEVGTDTIVPVRRRERGDDGGAPRTEDGTAAPFLAFDDRSGLGRIVRAVAPESGAGSVPVFTSHLAIALKAMTLEGKGVAWLPRSLVRDELAEGGRLVPAAPDEVAIAVSIIVMRPNGSLAPEAEALWQRLRRHAAAVPRHDGA